MASVSIKNFTRHAQVPRFPYVAVAKKVLPAWDISLVFVSATKARELNERLRKASYVPNVLSYALTDRSGEIIICLSEAKKQAPAYDMTTHEFVPYLFIHGLLHLKGWGHGVTMEECERNLLAQFTKNGKTSEKKKIVALTSLHETTHSHRHRHRHLSGKNSRRRGNH